jgi:hypothetical protein
MAGTNKIASQHPVEIHCRHCDTRFEMPIGRIRCIAEMSCPSCSAVIVLGTSEVNAQIRKIEKALQKAQQQLAKGPAFQGSTKPGSPSAEKLPTDMPKREDRG